MEKAGRPVLVAPPNELQRLEIRFLVRADPVGLHAPLPFLGNSVHASMTGDPPEGYGAGAG